MEGKYVKVVFVDNTEDIYYINALSVNRGTDDYFIKLGCVIQPDLSEEEVRQLEYIEAKSLFTFAATKRNIKEFIRLLQEICDDND
jgi:hypothetical protein